MAKSPVRNGANGNSCKASPPSSLPPGASVSASRSPPHTQIVNVAGNGVHPEGEARGDGHPGAPSGRVLRLRRDVDNGSDGGGTAEVTVKCDGCNEVGHEFRECPHRSDSAVELSEEEEESEEKDDSDEDYDGGEDSDDV